MACLLICIVSFGQSAKKAKASQTNAKTKATKANLELGKKLMEASDCDTCHEPEGTLIGPGYKEIALKYTNTPENIKYLASKIREGGGGVWGDIAMAPHPTLSPGQAQKIAQYLLTLKQ